MSVTYKYPRPALTVDAVVFRNMTNTEVLLIQRGAEPFKDMWAFPGGFVDMDETVETAAARELLEETGINEIKLHQFHTFSAINRDPRHRTVSVVFVGFTELITEPNAGDDAKNAKWFDLRNLPNLAFDHAEILEKIKNEVLIKKDFQN
jgi:8-oxo-dGTP diphosphatase